ncbi:sigma-54 dependent transcriptional regulator [Vibrio hannami]|uniref:sigma-54 dependent transcriptional regulator n=1 Tax=Vibrio hannami TaxID=2717094 RepID=UPI00240FA754|nr:sigma-54 dependent transcriptional regulator [Vibrio hannami]MDG3088781.1 sigma-54 dependent transcriptional regulator [Vibrio hannami]
MQVLAKLLVIEDNQDQMLQLGTILEFIGEQAEVINSTQISQIDFSKEWTGCIVGSVADEKAASQITEVLSLAIHIPLVVLSDSTVHLDEYPHYIGSLGQPLNYPQLSSALRHCAIFQGKQGLTASAARKNTLFRSLVGQSPGIQEVRHLIEQVAGTEANVLILGESGTGKEVVARNVHYHSARSNGPFVPINCGAIPAELLESELFGHEKGAFTGAITARKGRFELAEGGTIFLDEIGDMPMPMQVKLLRVLQERTFERVGGNSTIKVDVRIVAATHRNLESMIEEQSFREDLFYRLNVFPIEMPALKERQEDIPLLLQELMTRMEAEGSQLISFTPRAVDSLKEHHWPGNVRELANLVERMTILYPNSLVDVSQLPTKYRYSDIPEFQPEYDTTTTSIEEQEREALSGIFSESFAFEEEAEASMGTTSALPPEGVNLKELLADMEVNMISQALDAQDGVVARAADMLGMRRTTLVEKMKKYNLQR